MADLARAETRARRRPHAYQPTPAPRAPRAAGGIDVTRSGAVPLRGCPVATPAVPVAIAPAVPGAAVPVAITPAVPGVTAARVAGRPGTAAAGVSGRSAAAGVAGRSRAARVAGRAR